SSLSLYENKKIGEVIAPVSLTAEAGRLMLGCNITTATGDLRGRRISHCDPSVQLSAHHNDAEYINITRVRADDLWAAIAASLMFTQRAHKKLVTSQRVTEGVCFAYASQNALRQEVLGKCSWWGNKTATAGRRSPSCSYSLPERAPGAVEEDGRAGRHHHCGFLRQERRQQEGHRLPLSVYVLPKPEVSHVTSSSGVTEANCTAQSRPAADITWNIDGENQTLGPPILSAYDQGDGTTVVTSTILFQPGLLSNLSVKCIVHHQGLEKPLMVSLNTG
ncbi:OX-2 membrane glycoprotein-like protein, partial [Lates japonicus]